MAEFSKILNKGEESLWLERSAARREKMQLLWNEDDGIFIDYNTKTDKYSQYKSAASFYPLFLKVATAEQAEKTVKNLLPKLELEYGVTSGEKGSPWNCQWDYPNVWAPMQFLVYNALVNYGFEEDAKRLAEKYLKLLEKGFKDTGNFWEKYDGNTGEVTTNEYDAPPMMGWTAGLYLYFNSVLSLWDEN